MNPVRLLFVLFMLVLSGCASLPETRAARCPASNEAIVLKPGEVLVFGRILFSENGESKLPYGLGKPFWQLGSPKTAESRGRIIPMLSADKDGFFIYAIPAGRYEIAHVVPLGYQPFIDPALAFEAEEAGMAYYLGDIEVEYDAWSWLGGLWGNYITRINSVRVIDRFEQADGRLSVAMPGLVPIRKALLAPIAGRLPVMAQPFVPPIIHR